MDIHLTPALQQLHETTARLAAGIRAWGRLAVVQDYAPLTTGDVADQTISQIAHSASIVERDWMEASMRAHLYQKNAFIFLSLRYADDRDHPMHTILRVLLLNDDDWQEYPPLYERHDDYDASMRYLIMWLYRANRLDDLQAPLQERQASLSDPDENDLHHKRLLQLSILSALHETLQHLPTQGAPWSWMEPIVLDQFFLSLSGPQHDRPTYDLSAAMVSAAQQMRRGTR